MIRILIHLVARCAVAGLRLLDLNLLAIERDVVLVGDSVHGCIVLERQEAEAAAFLLLLIVHDDNFHHLAVAAEEHSQVGLGDVGGQAAEEDLREGTATGFGLLQRPRIALLRVDGSKSVGLYIWLVTDVIPYVFIFIDCGLFTPGYKHQNNALAYLPSKLCGPDCKTI